MGNKDDMSNKVDKRMRRILIIDDNPAIHGDFRKILGRAADCDLDALSAEIFGNQPSAPVAPTEFEIESAYQGREGLERVTQSLREGKPYAMAFVDMRMPPGWDGIETIEHLWKVDPELHVVICTAYADYSWSEVVTRLGGNDRWLVLKKPFDNAEVRQMAAAIAEKRRLLERVRTQMDDLEERVDRGTSALRDREERMQAMFDTAPDGIMTFDAKGTVESVNFAASQLFGWKPEAMVGMRVAELILPDGKLPFPNVRDLFHIAPNNAPAARELDSVRQDRNVFPALWTVGYFSNTEHQFYTAIIRDLTEYKLLQCELAQAQKLESVGQLAAGIAHEINSPTQYVGDNVRFLKDAFADLNGVLDAFDSLLAASEHAFDAGLVQGAQSARDVADIEYLKDEIPKTIDETLGGIERIGSIVRAMKEFSHPGSEDKAHTNLHESLQTTLTIARNEWKYVAEIETDFAPDMPQVPCLVGELNQVFLNLIVNAAHAIGDAVAETPGQKGTITIRTAHADRWAEIHISDTGTGIPQEIVGRVFDPFFTTKGVGKGTGQGLAIARSVVVDKHGGTIDVRTELGKGTTFRIRLPLDDSATTPNQVQQGAAYEPQPVG
jgi:PAS domain S-box-containing protein